MRLIANSTDRAAREELWISFLSLVRAYLAAASIGTEVPLALLHESAPGRLQIVGIQQTIKLEMDPVTGEGYWAVYGAEPSNRLDTADGRRVGDLFDVADEAGLLDEGAFRLHLDAEFEWTGKPGRLPLDQVAEALAMLAFE